MDIIYSVDVYFDGKKIQNIPCQSVAHATKYKSHYVGVPYLVASIVIETVSDQTMSELTDEYNRYCDAHDLPSMSADELVLEDAGKDHQDYLNKFIRRWEEAEERENPPPQPDPAVKYVCKSCGSDDVTRDALARWSTELQQWEFSSFLDNEDCNKCGEEATLIKVPA